MPMVPVLGVLAMLAVLSVLVVRRFGMVYTVVMVAPMMRALEVVTLASHVRGLVVELAILS